MTDPATETNEESGDKGMNDDTTSGRAMHPKKAEIYDALAKMRQDNAAAQARLTKRASLADYRALVRPSQQDGQKISVWSEALQAALDENEIVFIPRAEEPYYIDRSILIPSDRRIEAEDGAVIRLKKGIRTLMLRNRHVADGTHAPISAPVRDHNICITGGRWEESMDVRAGYGKTGMIDEERSFYGVSTAMLFNNLSGLTLQNMTFAHMAGFAVQCGDLQNAVMGNIAFDQCYADGLHLNGNIDRAWICDIHGQCGDDLVALNAYDWQNSSVNFGPMRCILCENLELSASSPYKAMRIQPGIYYYDDGSWVDCALDGIIVKNVRGIRTFKLYYQTPRYKLRTQKPERGAPGSGDWLFFEDISVDLAGPIDGFREYRESDPVRGAFAAFEIGANIKHLFFENIDLTLHREKYPLSYLLCAGPKSCVVDEGTCEIFDPYVSCKLEELHLGRIRINGNTPDRIEPYLKAVAFDDVNRDGFSSGRGMIERVEYEQG